MYRFVDGPVEGLCNSGRFLLWAMRSWTKAKESGHCPPRVLANSFASMGAFAALPDFHIAMALINRDSLQKIAIAPLDNIRIAEDEAILLGLWRDLAHGHFDRLRATLALMVDADSVVPIAEAMATAGARLIAAGFDLSELTGEPVKEVK